VTPKEIRKTSDSGIEILWADGHESRYSPARLRANCHCALCIHELTGERRIPPESEFKDTDLKVLRSDWIGNYALRFEFSDGHNTGIYTFPVLRGLCPCGSCNRTEGSGLLQAGLPIL